MSKLKVRMAAASLALAMLTLSPPGLMVGGAVVACLVSGVAAAQEKPADTMELLREKARADKKLVVASALELTDAEAKTFWPIYNAYQRDMIAHYDRVLSSSTTTRRPTTR